MLDYFSFDGSTSLTTHGELNHIILSVFNMFTLVDLLAWVNVGGGYYNYMMLEDEVDLLHGE